MFDFHSDTSMPKYNQSCPCIVLNILFLHWTSLKVRKYTNTQTSDYFIRAGFHCYKRLDYLSKMLKLCEQRATGLFSVSESIATGSAFCSNSIK